MQAYCENYLAGSLAPVSPLPIHCSSAARVNFTKLKLDHITPMLKLFQELTIATQSKTKLLSRAYKLLQNLAPEYFHLSFTYIQLLAVPQTRHFHASS